MVRSDAKEQAGKAGLVLVVGDVGQAVRFYSEVLGWAVVGEAGGNKAEANETNAGGSGPGGSCAVLVMPDGRRAILTGGGLEREAERRLAEAGEGAVQAEPADRVYIRLPASFGSLDALKRRAEAVGAVVTDDVEPHCWRMLTVGTPEGYQFVYWREEELTDEQLLALFVSGPDKLEASLAGLREDELDLSIAPGKWTIRQQVLHLVDLELAAAHKLKFILADAAPGRPYASSRFEQDAWAEGMRYAERPIAVEVGLFRLLREHIAAICRHLPDAMRRSVVLASGRTETAGQLMKSMYAHANTHVRRIAEIRERHSGSGGKGERNGNPHP